MLRDAANAPATLPTLLRLVREMEPSGREHVVVAIDAADKQVSQDLLSGLGDPAAAAQWIVLLTPELRTAIERAATRWSIRCEWNWLRPFRSSGCWERR